MKNLRITLIITLLLAGITQSQAQFFNTLRTSPWVVGGGWNIVDDNGQKTKNIFDFSTSFNILSYPTSVRVEKYYTDGVSFVFNGSYNKYNTGKNINGDFNQPSTFLSLDLGAKYSFNELYNIDERWFNFANDVFDYYAAMGVGYTYRNTNKVGSSGTFNIGFGLNTMVYQNWGFNLEAVGKFGLSGKLIQTAANYTQYSFGIIYKIESSRRLSSKGDNYKKFSTRKSRTKI